MKVRFRYAHALLALALLAGQVQYAYTTYFCTEQHAAVSKPTIKMQSADRSSGSTICDECCGVIPVHHGAALATLNCIQITTHTKSVVSSFTSTEEVVSYHATSRFVCSRGPVESNQLSAIGNLHFSSTDSPPLPLHITNLNFRI